MNFSTTMLFILGPFDVGLNVIYSRLHSSMFPKEKLFLDLTHMASHAFNTQVSCYEKSHVLIKPWTNFNLSICPSIRHVASALLIHLAKQFN